MTDLELLELAAKAAGYMVRWDGIYCEFRHCKEGQGHGPFWNPLVNDGDALRLAANIELSIQFSWTDDLKTRTISCCKAGQDSVEEDYIDVGSMRRAIVMAAADIGMNLA